MDAVWRQWVTHYATPYPQSMPSGRRDARIVSARLRYVHAQGVCGLVQVACRLGGSKRTHGCAREVIRPSQTLVAWVGVLTERIPALSALSGGLQADSLRRRTNSQLLN